ncbi:MAG: hypothetical protein ACPKM0_01740 [Pleomorphochaeta sp.]
MIGEKQNNDKIKETMEMMNRVNKKLFSAIERNDYIKMDKRKMENN